MSEFGDDFITITDEDGQEYELEVLMRVEYRGSEYLGVCPAGADEDAELDAVYAIMLESSEEEPEDDD